MPKPAMVEWESPADWTAEGKWFVRTGGEFSHLAR
jgi:hypothetical protein